MKSRLHGCYENCSVFVMTSRVESIGLVALKAMASGCLSIDALVMPERGGSSGFVAG
jgi:glycosyltransferase involved in cell wall biosynthesis